MDEMAAHGRLARPQPCNPAGLAMPPPLRKKLGYVICRCSCRRHAGRRSLDQFAAARWRLMERLHADMAKRTIADAIAAMA
jgi:hypothetical protein